MGTPKSLNEAVQNALMVGPMNEAPERVVAHVRDFLAQRFGAAMLERPESQSVLDELWETITGEKRTPASTWQDTPEWTGPRLKRRGE
jgi:hypothetical protein